MDRKQRVIFSDNGTLYDISGELNDYRTGTYTLPIVAAEDALYVGCEFPFNHKYFDVSTANTSTAALGTISYWDGSTWRAAVDVRDETSTGGKTLAQDGAISWALDPDHNTWVRKDDSTDLAALSTGPRIFDLYWLKITFGSNLYASTALAYLGECFNTDTELASYYPDTAKANLKTAWNVSNWQGHAYQAAEEIVKELRRQSVLKRREQIMDASLFTIPAIHKAASIIYGGLGSAYRDAAALAEEKYRKSLDLNYFEVDADGSGTVDPVERHVSVRFGTR